jgi:glycerol kinase
MRETTALRAAIAARFATGVWKHFDDLKNIKMGGRFYFEPKMPEKESKRMYRRWEKAVAMSKGWDNGEDEDEREEEKEKMEDGTN